MTEQEAETTAADTDPEARMFTAASPTALVVVLALSGVLLYTFIGGRAFFVGIFQDMRVMLPELTVIALSPLPSILVGVLAVAGILKELLVRNRVITFVFNGVHVCLLILLSTIYTFAMNLPFAELMRAMSEAPS